MNKIAVVLFNLGGPDSLDAVEPFLFNLFSDPLIFKILVGQKVFAKLISSRRAPKVKKEYEQIGGKSPINEWTEVQRTKLENKLKDKIPDVRVFTAMRYWKPFTEDVISSIEKEDFEKIVLLPLYPHYSITTTGSSFQEWKNLYKGEIDKLIYIDDFYQNELYIEAINERINETLQKFPQEIRSETQLVFSAHGTPVSLVKKGDPYNRHIQKTVEEVMRARDYSHGFHLCYQSKVGPVKWLEPSTDNMIRELSAADKKHLLIIPISFVSDHVETLFELNIEYRHVADESGIKNYIVMKGLNDSDLFIKALEQLVLNSIKN